MRDLRRAVWVHQFQTRLFWRFAAYLALFCVGLCTLVFLWRLLHDEPGKPVHKLLAMLQDNALVFLSLLVLLPVILWDALHFTHRLVGPLERFRRTMREVAAGQPVRRMKLRENDFLDDFAADFNLMLESVQRQGIPVLKPNEPAEETRRHETA
jgi:HAMP domain-containing protein